MPFAMIVVNLRQHYRTGTVCCGSNRGIHRRSSGYALKARDMLQDGFFWTGIKSINVSPIHNILLI